MQNIEIKKEDLFNKGDKKHSERIYFPELDGLRFFAFLLVFMRHTALFSRLPYLNILWINGWFGVDLFFALSAFLFTKLLIIEYQKTNAINFKKFYLRRIFRIWPIYFLIIGISCILFKYIYHGVFSKYVCLRIIGLLTFSDNIMAAFKGFNPIHFVSHLWTIGYEEQFYVFIPIIIFLFVRSSFKTKIISLVSILFLFNVIRFFMIANNVPHPAVYTLPITHFESIIMGIVIGFGGIDFLSRKIHPLIIFLIGLLCFVLISKLPDIAHISYWLIATYSLTGLSSSLILYAVLCSNTLKRVFSKKIFVFLGKRSYGLYVYHVLGIMSSGIAIKHLRFIPSNYLASFLYALFFTILFSILSYKFIETPFLILKKKFEIIKSRPI